MTPVARTVVLQNFVLSSMLVAVIAALLYLPGLPGEFVFDDFPNIVNNPGIALERLDARSLLQMLATSQPSGYLRTLPNLTFALDYWRGGGADAATFKTTNILIHAVTALSLAWLFRSILLAAGLSHARARGCALLLALGWAAHPLLVSSVLYAVQRLQTLGTLFLILALLSYVHARRAQMAGTSGRTGMLGAVLLWALALSCKEDSLMLPAYALALELTVLRFETADPRLSRRLKLAYAVATALGAATYLFIAIPHHWTWIAYEGRDFSTPERLLTQARMLCLYLWQIVLPLPSHMPFHYDWVEPSRNLLKPWSTLASLVFLIGLLAAAVLQRRARPLVSLGIFIFFAAHFPTSNVVGLELAYEHRNHFALTGVVLAVGCLLAEAARMLRLNRILQVSACAALLALLGTATAMRAKSWSSNLEFAQSITQSAPHSGRAWIQLCAEQYTLGGGATRMNTRLDEAITACENGSRLAPGTLNSPALLLVLKQLRGDLTAEDWAEFRQRIRTAPNNWDNRRAPWLLIYNFRKGVPLDTNEMSKVFQTQDQTQQLKPAELTAIADFFMTELDRPQAAMPYFAKAIARSPPYSTLPLDIANRLRAGGRTDLADQVEKLVLERLRSPDQ